MDFPSSRVVTAFNAYRRSVVTRLVLFGVVFALVGLAGRMTVLLPLLRERLVQLSSAHQLAIADYVARDIDAKIRMREDFLRRIAASLPVGLLSDRRRLEDWLKERQEIDPLFSNGLVVVPTTGQGVTDYPPLAGRRDLDFSRRDWFVEARRQRRLVLGKPSRGRIDGAPLIVMAAPVFDRQGQVAAVLAGVTALAAPDFLNLLQETHIGNTGGFLLISPRDDLFVAATDPAKILTALPRPGVNPLHDRAMAGYRGTGITTNLAGIEELSAIASIPSTGWFLVARVPTREALAALDGARYFILRNGVFMTLVVIVLVWVTLHHFFRPLVSASRLIHRMAKGEIELQPVTVVHHDEVGDLAEGFNFLLARLDEATAQKVAVERQRVEEKERMGGMLRQWMADTSHELRTPISVLRAQIEAIQDGIHAVDARRLELLHGEVMGLSRLVDDLSVLARSDVGQLECRHDPVDPLVLLDDAVAAFRQRYAAAGLGIDWSEWQGAPPVVSGDSARLRQLFSNLLENSLRYTDAGGRLSITAALADAMLVVQFDDTAPGAPAAALPHLFERFFRGDASRSRERGGSGLGLALCRTLVEAHGGSIDAAPSALGGLAITVRLPCVGGME